MRFYGFRLPGWSRPELRFLERPRYRPSMCLTLPGDRADRPTEGAPLLPAPQLLPTDSQPFRSWATYGPAGGHGHDGRVDRGAPPQRPVSARLQPADQRRPLESDWQFPHDVAQRDTDAASRSPGGGGWISVAPRRAETLLAGDSVPAIGDLLDRG